MKIIFLLLVFIDFFYNANAVDKTEPELNQSLRSFNAPIREIALRWEYSKFGTTFDRNTGQLLNQSSITIGNVLRGKSRNINGFITQVELEKLFYPKNGAQQEFKKLKDKLNSGILPETIVTSKIVPFIITADGKPLIDTVKDIPEINTVDQLREFMSKNNIDVTLNGVKKD